MTTWTPPVSLWVNHVPRDGAKFVAFVPKKSPATRPQGCRELVAVARGHVRGIDDLGAETRLLRMCNRARNAGDPETLLPMFKALWASERPRDNRFNPVELAPRSRAYVVREEAGERLLDIMSWDILGGAGKWPMTNVRQLGLPQWRRLAERPENRCLIPLTEFCEWTPDTYQVGVGRPLKGEMWFQVDDQPIFALAGFWRRTASGNGFTMVTCDPNELVAPIHPKAMITILQRQDHACWLEGSYDDVVALQRPYDAARMTGRRPSFPTRAKR